MPLLLFVGRVVEQKNIGFLLESLALIRGEARFHLLIVGDGEGMPHFRKKVTELGLQHEVRFAGAVRDRVLLQNIYAAADLFTFPSVYDTDGLVKREAASCGCPSALIEGSNAAEGIVDGFDGFTTPLDRNAYAALLLNCIRNPELLVRVGLQSRDSVYVSWETVVDRAYEEYKNIIANYDQKKAYAQGKRHYSVPLAVAYEIYSKQAVRVKFTTRAINREARHRTVVIQKAAIHNIRRLREAMRSLQTWRR